MSDGDCVFCKINIGVVSASMVYEDKGHAAFLPLKQAVFGHTVIIPKRHCETLLEMSKSQLSDLMFFTQELACLYEKRLGSNCFNLLLASGKPAQQSVQHLHFHYFPRFEGDGLDTWPSLPELSEEKRTEFLHRVRGDMGAV